MVEEDLQFSGKVLNFYNITIVVEGLVTGLKDLIISHRELAVGTSQEKAL